MKKFFFFSLLGIIFSLGFFSYALAITPIENIQAKQEGNNIILTWNAIPEAAYYKVFNRENNQLFPNGKVENSTTYTLTNTEAGKTYKFAIRAYKSGASSYFAGGDKDFAAPTTSTPSEGQPIPIGAPFPGEKSEVTLMEHITAAHKWASIIGTLAAILMLIFAGFKYTTSAGNPEALQDAKDTMIGALIGLAIILLTYILLQVVGVKVERAPL